MADDDAFLQAIAAAPDDDAPRLVYADWLDEHDEPDRAEYLRLACQANSEAEFDRLRELATRVRPQWVVRAFPHWPRIHPRVNIVRKVARGRRTSIYEAVGTHPDIRGRRVAIRVLDDPECATGFVAACQAHAGLQHEHIPALFELARGIDHFYAMRAWIDGTDLRTSLGPRGPHPTTVLHIVTSVASALEAIHWQTRFHLSVVPRHVLLGRDGKVWLIGIGEDTVNDPIPDSAIHLAPEQFGPEVTADPGSRIQVPVGPATDVYQLAELAIWMFTGEHPFGSPDTPADRIRNAKRLRDCWRTDLIQPLPAAAQAVLRRALLPGPASRYETPGAFAYALVEGFGSGGSSWWQFWRRPR